MKKIFFFTFITAISFVSCEKTDNPEQITTTEEYGYKNNQTHNLNVVYFVPNDVEKPQDYHRRLSEILLNTQEFFGKEMERNGYGYKTFGLLKDKAKKRIKLIEITGSQGKAAYPYSGGAGAVQAEINAYKAMHASEFTGDHYLIIIPATTYDTNGEPGGVPFYGIGRSCYALDYADQDIKYLGTGGTLGTRATKWIGGMVHELGHGLNLPHNRQKHASESSLGMALMWAGNSTWGNSKTFLTAADCAVLNTNQIFNTDNKTYYGAVTAAIESIEGSYSTDKGAIVVSGKFTTDTPVTDILYFNDPNVNNEGTGVNHDYNAIAWTSKPIAQDSLYIEMPIADLEHKSDGIPYELKVKLVHDNGQVTETIYPYTFEDGVPVIGFSTAPSKPEISKQDWVVAAFSSEETVGENGAVVNIIDDNLGTYWHSLWTSATATYPHEITIDMQSIQTVTGFSFAHRASLSRAVKEVEIQYSTDGVDYTSAGSFDILNTNGRQYNDFNSVLSFRYFKVRAKSSWDGEQFASIAEVGLYTD